MRITSLKTAMLGPQMLERLQRPGRSIDRIALRAGIYTSWYVDEDRFAIGMVPTRAIRFLQARPFDKLADAGRVIGGYWDRDVLPFEEDLLYQACLARFGQGKDWRDTAFVQEALARVEAGARFWHGCRSVSEVHARCREVDALYESIAANGYRRRVEVNQPSGCAALDEVTVNIGHDGRLIRNNSGMHRLCIARILGIEEIPARILVRHRAWHERSRRQAAGAACCGALVLPAPLAAGWSSLVLPCLSAM